jgi:hypothetical protein
MMSSGQDRFVPVRKIDLLSSHQMPSPCDAGIFLSEVTRLSEAEPTIRSCLLSVVPKSLAALARATDDQLFNIGIGWAVLNTHAEVGFYRPVYRSQLVDRLNEIKRTLLTLEDQLDAIVNPKDELSSMIQKSLIEILTIESRDQTAELKSLYQSVSSLIALIPLAQFIAPRFAPARRGRPKEIAMRRFIARLEFAARAAGGHWTLNKTDQRGSVVEALQKLRDFLPADFLPIRHPYSSYQKALTKARLDWNKRLPP